MRGLLGGWRECGAGFGAGAVGEAGGVEGVEGGGGEGVDEGVGE